MADALPSETLAAEDALAAAVAVSLAVAVQGESGLIVEAAFTSTADVFRSYRLGRALYGLAAPPSPITRRCAARSSA